MSVSFGTHFFFKFDFPFPSDLTKSQRTGHCGISVSCQLLLLCFNEELLGNIIVLQGVLTPRITNLI